MQVIIDRFEGDYVIVELPDLTFAQLPRCVTPGDAQEGDVLSICVDAEETERRQQELKQKMKNIWAD